MTAADDLRALSAAATPGPWDGHRHTIFEPIDDAPDGEAGAEVADVDHPEDVDLIVWLRNHADALADLIDAVKAIPRHTVWLDTGGCSECEAHGWPDDWPCPTEWAHRALDALDADA